ncbi:hypothetical protein [Ensifer soli]|uniref:hypothetical protein n=1 Tax=Ciceribacter sp. sgz301302 TaxID=3342379 RepID=UPI0035BB8647
MQVENNVIIGKDGELFLSSDRHFTLDLMLGKKSVDEKSFANFSENLKRRQRLCQQNKAQHVHLVAPDKHVVYRDRFPIENFISIGDLYRKNVEQDFLFPVSELRASKRRTYGQTDTHWSVWGQIRIAVLVAQAFGFTPEELRAGEDLLDASAREETSRVVGDLGLKLNPQRSEPAVSFAPGWKVSKFSNGIQRGNDGRIIASYSTSPVSRGRLVVFGDSFLAQTLDALSVFFKEVLFCRTRFFHSEIVVNARPDFVLTENVERYFSAVQSDLEAPPMLLMAEMNGKGPRYAPGHAVGIGAMLSGRNRFYRNFVATLDAG